jgi:hypothetical protein
LKDNKHKKWQESAVLLLILLLTFSLLWIGLSGWKRTPHIYAYDEGTAIEKETQLAQEGDDRQEEEKSRETTPPRKQQEDSETENAREDARDSREKKEGKDKNSKKSTEGEPDSEGETGDEDGDGEGTGSEEGDGDGEGTGDGGEEGTPTAAPEEKPEKDTAVTNPPAATKTPTATPKATVDPEDTVVSLSCTWSDKDSLLYKREIPKDTITVKATYSSGKEVELDASEYTIAGLKNDSVGQHIMTVIYGDATCKLVYKVNNYAKSISYEWDTKDECYKDEVIDDGVLQVTVLMADKTEESLSLGEYTLSGVDNQKTGVEQTFTIRYLDFTLTGTCRFWDRKVTYINQYYSGGNLQDTETINVTEMPKEDAVISMNDSFRRVIKNGVLYVVDDMEVVADGKKKNVPYRVDRYFELTVTRKYEAVE